MVFQDEGQGLRKKESREAPYKSEVDQVLSRLKLGYAPIITLCGSTRFMETFHKANREYSLRGWIVLTVEIATYDRNEDPQLSNPVEKKILDELHLRKIDISDEILVLNVGGYIGESTAKEIAYASKKQVPVRYLEQVG